MANWSDPRATAAPAATRAGVAEAAFDAGLRSYMLSIYNYMASGVLLTGVVALLFASSGLALQILGGPGRSADGQTNLVGALRRAMATTGYSDVKEFQRVEVVIARHPSA